MQIWPAIDIRNGKCVRLAQGDYAKETVYGSDPADMAHRWALDGATGLHVVDLDGARQGSPVNRKQIAAIAGELEIPCQVGGGVRDEQTIIELLEMGVSRLVVGTKAVADRDWLQAMSQKYEGRLLVGIDTRSGMMATDGWEKTSDVSAVDFVTEIAKLPIAGIIYTDIARDGMLDGPNFPMLTEMVAATQFPVIASGGVTTAADVTQLTTTGVAGCIVGRSLYEGRLTLIEAMEAANRAISSPLAESPPGPSS